jgi:hypothetical protein
MKQKNAGYAERAKKGKVCVFGSLIIGSKEWKLLLFRRRDDGAETAEMGGWVDAL